MDDSLAPAFLVAVPQLLDPNFRQSVVLLLQQGSEGALGLVVNRESPLLLSDLCRDHRIDYQGDPGKRVRVGGPVQPEQGLVLFDAFLDDPEGRLVLDGLRVSASTGTLTRLCGRPGGRYHCYSGYAGWAPGQIERELAEGSWIVVRAEAALVLDHPVDDLWTRVLADNGIDPAAIVPGGGEVA